MDRNLAINLVRVTEMASLGAAQFLGRGDKNGADQAAVEAMRRMFNTIDVAGTVVIGEGEMDEAPMLYIGEKVGSWEETADQVDIAVDPVDGTTAVSKGLNNAIAIVAMAPKGCLLNAPDMYMDKLAVGPKAKGKVNLDNPLIENLKIVAQAQNKNLSDLTVTMLDRERHQHHIKVCREAGTRIKLFGDGDVAAAIDTCFEHTGVDIMIGSGGAPEGVLAAAAMKCLGGDFQGRLIISTPEEEERCKIMGADCKRLLTLDELVRGDEVYFAATGVSDGNLLRGVTFKPNNVAVTHSIVMRSETGTIRFVEAIHKLDSKPGI